MAYKIAFLRKGPWPPANVSAVQALRHAFPAAEIIELDLLPLLRQRHLTMLLNGCWMLGEYGCDLILGRKSPRSTFIVTALMFHTFRRLVQQVVRAQKYTFSFQMQSLFDGSTPGLPHFVYTDHTLLANRSYPGFRPADLYSPAWQRLEPSIYINARAVFTRSQNISRSLINDYGLAPEQVHCVHVGSNVPLDLDTPILERYQQQRVLFVGIDWQRKGGPELLQAWPAVLARHPHAQLVIAGAAPRTGRLRNCHVLGRVDLATTSVLYQQASLFCLPTKLEPFGIAVLEALAHHLPVITTNIGAMPEIVQPGVSGWLVEPGTVAQLAQTLIEALSNPERCAALGRTGAQLVQQQYNWQYVGEHMRTAIEAQL